MEPYDYMIHQLGTSVMHKNQARDNICLVEPNIHAARQAVRHSCIIHAYRITSDGPGEGTIQPLRSLPPVKALAATSQSPSSSPPLAAVSERRLGKACTAQRRRAISSSCWCYASTGC